MVKIIPEETITTYVKRSQQILSLKKEQKKLHDKLVKAFKKGYVCEDTGPYLVVMDRYERTSVPWKAWVKRLLPKVYGMKWKTKLVAAQEQSKEWIDRLDCKLNPDYQGKDPRLKLSKTDPSS